MLECPGVLPAMIQFLNKHLTHCVHKKHPKELEILTHISFYEHATAIF